jgi:hypothetical protein
MLAVNGNAIPLARTEKKTIILVLRLTFLLDRSLEECMSIAFIPVTIASRNSSCRLGSCKYSGAKPLKSKPCEFSALKKKPTASAWHV